MRQPVLINLFLLLALALGNYQAKAAYYETLPKGVRLGVYRYVRTGKIKSSFTGSQQETDFNFKFDINTDMLKDLNSGTQFFFDSLKSLSQEAYDEFSFGTFEANAQAEVEVNALGFAYGFTNRLTSYVTFPYYKGQVTLDMAQTQDSNVPKVRGILAKKTNKDETDALIKQLTEQLPEASGEIIQSVIMNYFGYQPLGNWRGEGLGDMELGAIYRWTDWSLGGFASTFGVVLPTGRPDDPDILQDLPFGDGQMDIFGEVGGGVKVVSGYWDIDSYVRYTHQLASTKRLRIPESEDVLLGEQHATFNEKLGDKVDYSASMTFSPVPWIQIIPEYLYNYTMKSKYTSSHDEANSILAKDTDQNSHTLKAMIKYSTLDLYRKGKFFAPMSFGVSGQKIIKGKNIPNYTRFDLEFRMFF